MTGTHKFPLKDDLPVLKVAEVQPKGQKTETNRDIWHPPPRNDGMETVKHALLEALPVLDGADKERRL